VAARDCAINRNYSTITAPSTLATIVADFGLDADIGDSPVWMGL